MRSGNGREYTSNEFGIFYRYFRIKRELTTPYNTQQNGVEEIKNRTIMEEVKIMSYWRRYLALKHMTGTPIRMKDVSHVPEEGGLYLSSQMYVVQCHQPL